MNLQKRTKICFLHLLAPPPFCHNLFICYYVFLPTSGCFLASSIFVRAFLWCELIYLTTVRLYSFSRLQIISYLWSNVCILITSGTTLAETYSFCFLFSHISSFVLYWSNWLLSSQIVKLKELRLLPAYFFSLISD